MEKTEELKGLLREAFEAEWKTKLDELKKAQEDKFKALEEAPKELKARIEKIENLPLTKRSLVVPGGGSTDVYMGYKMAYQGRDLLNRPSFKSEAHPIIADPDKREEFAKFLINVVKAKMHQDPIAKAALQEGTAAEGGYVVPDEYTDEILAFAREQSFALQLCRIWPMSGDVRRVPAESGAVSVAWTDEESAATESEPTLAEVVLTAKRLDAFSIASNELIQDANVDIVSWLTELFAEAMGQELDNQVLNGTGSPWSGLLTAKAGYSVVMAAGETNFSSISADDLSEMISKVPSRRRVNARFFIHRTVLHYIRTLKDSNNDYIYAKPGNGVPARVWEYPYLESEKAPSTTGADTAFVAFGDLRYFALGRRLQSMSLDLDPYGKFTEYQTRFRIVNRWGGSVGLANAFVRLLTAAS